MSGAGAGAGAAAATITAAHEAAAEAAQAAAAVDLLDESSGHESSIVMLSSTLPCGAESLTSTDKAESATASRTLPASLQTNARGGGADERTF